MLTLPSPRSPILLIGDARLGGKHSVVGGRSVTRTLNQLKKKQLYNIISVIV